MKKRFWIVLACVCWLSLVLSQKALPAHADVVRQEHGRWHQPGESQWSSLPAFTQGGGVHENMQIQQGESTVGNTYWFIGQDQGNNGNTGHNWGSIVDHSLNSGNQIIVRHWTGLNIRRGQSLFGSAGSYNHVFFVGINQGNTGNSGVNENSIDDGDRNSGNQVID
jgi:hypothetical protein